MSKRFQFTLRQMFAAVFLFSVAAGFAGQAFRAGPNAGGLYGVVGFAVFSGGLVGAICGSTLDGLLFSAAAVAIYLLGYALM